jgi:hypothetical protein
VISIKEERIMKDLREKTDERLFEELNQKITWRHKGAYYGYR